MKKFVLRVFLFSGFIGIFLFIYSDHIFRGEELYGATINDYKKEKDIEIAIFGSSHSMNAFDPRIFELELGMKTFNLSCTNQRLPTTQLISESVAEEHDLKLAIIDIFSMTVLWPKNSERGKSLELQSIDYIPFSFSKIQRVSDLFQINEWPFVFSETLRNHKEWPEKISANQVEPYFVWNGIDIYNGYRNSNTVITEKSWNNFVSVYKKRSDTVTLPNALKVSEKKRIRDIITVFQKKNIPVLIVNSPSYLKDHYEYDVVYNKLIAEYLNELGIPYVNFNSLWDDLSLDKSYFKDPNHLNIKGAIKASNYLANYIRDSMGIRHKTRTNKIANQRYEQLKNGFENVLFSIKMDSAQKAGLFGVENVVLYEVDKGRLELLFITSEDTINNQPMRLDFYVSEEEIAKLPESLMVYDKDTRKASTYGALKTEIIIKYNGINFIPYTFNYPYKDITKMEFYAGLGRRVKVFTIENLTITDERSQ